jgi:2-dehydro-3-deoxygluconokinase
MPDLVTLGETMIVLNAARTGPLRYAESFNRSLGGAESNVAAGLVRQGYSAGWVSRLGDDEWGRYIAATLRGEGVDLSHVSLDPDAPTGLYVKERPAAGDPRVTYYRRGSAASRLSPADLDEGYIASARILHVTGITPALSPSCREAVFAAVAIARRAGVTVSFDPNMRRKLWSAGEARAVFRELAAQADILLPGRDEAELMTGLSDPVLAARALMELAPLVVTKLGPEGCLVGTERVDGFPLAPVDTVGAGDAFAAAFLAGRLDGLPPETSARRACAAGALVTQVVGDWEGMPTRAKLDAFISGKEAAAR